MTKFYSHYDWGVYDSMTILLELAGMKAVDKPKDADIIVFNGGSDIATEIYNESPVAKGIPAYLTNRDREELALFEDFHREGKFLLGICRGAQLLNCLNGGTLWQHVDNHSKDHEMIDLLTGKKYHTTSTHHQMMRPTKEATIIAVASEAKNKWAHNVEEHFNALPALADGKDIEIVWYPKTRSLCIQGHPEYVPGTKFATYCLDLVEQYMNQKAAA